MYEVKTLNNIDRAGLTVLSNAGMMVNNESENPSALLVRSAKLHDTVFGDNLLAIGRAGVGTDTSPRRAAPSRASWSSTPPAPMPRPLSRWLSALWCWPPVT